MAKGDDIEERLIDFAVRIIRVSEALPDKPAGRHIRGQLLRCGTSPAPSSVASSAQAFKLPDNQRQIDYSAIHKFKN